MSSDWRISVVSEWILIIFEATESSPLVTLQKCGSAEPELLRVPKIITIRCQEAKTDGETICYGAIGVGGTKMKIHKAAIESLFASNDRLLDAEAIFALGRELEAEQG